MTKRLNAPFQADEVARIFRVSVATVRLWAREGHLPAETLTNGDLLFESHDVARVLRQRQAGR